VAEIDLPPFRKKVQNGRQLVKPWADPVFEPRS
jgi:hypothetical protein